MGGKLSPQCPPHAAPVPTPISGSDHLPVLDESGRVATRPEKWSLESSPFPNWASITILRKEGSGQGFLSYLLADIQEFSGVCKARLGLVARVSKT